MLIRSILAVFAGLIALTIVAFAIEAVADPLVMRVFPAALPDAAAVARSLPMRLFMLLYTTFAIAVGGYITAWIARRARLLHAAIMGAVELAFTFYVMIAAPFPEPVSAPRWSFIASVILMIPAACLGAAIQSRRRPSLKAG